MKKKIETFIKDCIKEYPVNDADIMNVRIDAKYGSVKVYIGKYGSPLSYSKESEFSEIKEREDIKSVALEVFN